MKKAIKISVIISILVVLSALVFLIQQKQGEKLVSELNIEISYLSSDKYIVNEDIEATILKVEPEIRTKSIKDIHTLSIETELIKNPYIADVDVYKKVNGEIHVMIKQRHPIARVETSKSSFYIGSDGGIMPVSTKIGSHVMIINGHLKNYNYNDLIGLNIRNSEESVKLAQAFELASYMHTNELFNSLMEQVYINKHGEFEFVPKLGKHYVLFGDMSRLEEKFSNLEHFYRQGISQVGWDAYSKVNLKFENQVVCTK